MSQRGCLILGALVLLPFLIVGLVRMGCKAARRANYGAAGSVDTHERELATRSEFVLQESLIS